MILEELVLTNFGLYRGRNVVKLAPGRINGRPAPIILFGGMNGGGKTTLLDAVQLALYGPRARCSKRAGRSWEDFLRESIHHGVDPHEGAAVELSFRYVAEGEESLYNVRREWNVEDGRLRETLSVSRNGVVDRWLSDNWNQAVEDLIPLGISQLFFFDAEQIRFLADDETGNAALASAVKSLLGLDLAERLIADTRALERRLAKSGDGEDDEPVRRLEDELERVQSQLTAVKGERAGLENDCLRAKRDLQQADERFASIGGRHWEQREAIGKRLDDVKRRVEVERARLVALASGALPLGLVTDLLRDVVEQDNVERQVREARVVGRILAERDEEVLRRLREEGVGARVLGRIEAIQARDRAERQAGVSEEEWLGLSEAASGRLRELVESSLGELGGECRGHLEELERLERERDELERSAASVPEEEVAREVVVQFKAAAERSAVLYERAKRLDGEIERLKRERHECERRLAKLRKSRVEHEIAAEEGARLTALVDRTRETMRAFLTRATAAKIERLSGLVTESFRFLLRKKTLVRRIDIAPDTFAITLHDDRGTAVPKERLSEGEKQIFAISVLWGLARASARPLPAIIDTPMARLDSEHRGHLVERYFPNASHQVLILSTDTEVDRAQYEELRPFITRAYHLNYDDERRITVPEEGYFWRTEIARQEIGGAA